MHKQPEVSPLTPKILFTNEDQFASERKDTEHPLQDNGVPMQLFSMDLNARKKPRDINCPKILSNSSTTTPLFRTREPASKSLAKQRQHIIKCFQFIALFLSYEISLVFNLSKKNALNQIIVVLGIILMTIFLTISLFAIIFSNQIQKNWLEINPSSLTNFGCCNNQKLKTEKQKLVILKKVLRHIQIYIIVYNLFISCTAGVCPEKSGRFFSLSMLKLLVGMNFGFFEVIGLCAGDALLMGYNDYAFSAIWIFVILMDLILQIEYLVRYIFRCRKLKDNRSESFEVNDNKIEPVKEDKSQKFDVQNNSRLIKGDEEQNEFCIKNLKYDQQILPDMNIRKKETDIHLPPLVSPIIEKENSEIQESLIVTNKLENNVSEANYQSIEIINYNDKNMQTSLIFDNKRSSTFKTDKNIQTSSLISESQSKPIKNIKKTDTKNSILNSIPSSKISNITISDRSVKQNSFENKRKINMHDMSENENDQHPKIPLSTLLPGAETISERGSSNTIYYRNENELEVPSDQNEYNSQRPHHIPNPSDFERNEGFQRAQTRFNFSSIKSQFKSARTNTIPKDNEDENISYLKESAILDRSVTQTANIFDDLLNKISEILILVDHKFDVVASNFANINKKSNCFLELLNFEILQKKETIRVCPTQKTNFDYAGIDSGKQPNIDVMFNMKNVEKLSTNLTTVYKLMDFLKFVNDSREPDNRLKLPNMEKAFHNLENAVNKGYVTMNSIKSDVKSFRSYNKKIINEAPKSEFFKEDILIEELIILLKAVISRFSSQGSVSVKDYNLFKRDSSLTFIYKSVIIEVSFSGILETPAVYFIMTDMKERIAIIDSEDKNCFKNSLLNSISHELRTPINFCQPTIEDLAEEFTKLTYSLYQDFDITNQAEEDIDMMYRSIISLSRNLKHMDFLIDGFMDFSSIEIHNFCLFPEMTDIQQVISEAIDLYQYQTEAKNVKTYITFDKELAVENGTKWKTDKKRFSIILLAIYHNSVKFTEDGVINIFITQEISNILKIVVSDDGIGIDPQELVSLRQTLKNYLSSYKTKQSSGIGLGLRVASALQRFLGDKSYNKLEITSTPDKGTSVTFYLKFLETQDTSAANEIVNDTNEMNVQKHVKSMIEYANEKENDIYILQNIANKTLSHKITMKEKRESCFGSPNSNALGWNMESPVDSIKNHSIKVFFYK